MSDLKMPDINRVEIAGRLGRDPELKYTSGGVAYCKTSVCVSRKYKDKNGDLKEETTWVEVTVWNKMAEYVGDKMKKGFPVYVEGKLVTNSWEKDGQKHSRLEIRADRIQQLDWHTEKSESTQPQQQPIEEDIPF